MDRPTAKGLGPLTGDGCGPNGYVENGKESCDAANDSKFHAAKAIAEGEFPDCCCSLCTSWKRLNLSRRKAS